MIFLILFALLLLVLATSLILAPYFNSTDQKSDSASDIDVYKSQLVELEAEEEAGTLSEEEAKAARLEIERRILQVDQDDRQGRDSTQPSKAGAYLLAAFVVIGTSALYLWIGQPNYPSITRAEYDARFGTPTMPDINQMLARLEERLAQNPDDVEGWAMLGRSSMVIGNLSRAVEAYEKASELASNDSSVFSALGEARVMASEGKITPEAQSAFDRAIELDPSDIRARLYSGFGHYQRDEKIEALQVWNALIQDAPEDAPWVTELREQVRQTEAELASGETPSSSTDQ